MTYKGSENLLRLKYISFNLLLFLLIGCINQKGVNMKKELLETDKAFSALCQEKGMNHAFLFYVAEGGVMLRPNSMPIVGKSNIVKLFNSDDSKIDFSWDPLYADVAKSGELGYTYGSYKLTYGDSSPQEGTYVSVWKKNSNNEWKFVLDSGNNGVDKQ